MKDFENLEMMLRIRFILSGFWYGIGIVLFFVALFTGKEVFALLALVAAMMKKD